jgi:pyruvyltransferase
MAGAGSIIEILHEKSEGNRVQVWGSGFIRDGRGLVSPNLVFHAVRGKLSRERIDTPVAALGDPALLLPLVVNPQSRGKKYQLGIIPHYVDAASEKLQRFRGCAQVKIINVFDPIPRIVDAINACQMIVSSSLHGLIVCDAYGVPNFWIRLSGDLVGGDYKFRDYYSLYDQSPKPRELADFDLGDWQSWSQEYRNVQPMVRKIQAELLRVLPGLPASHASFAGAGSLPGTR